MNFLKVGMLAVAILMFYSAEAQLEKPHISPSPNASATIASTNVDMSYYAGTANISIPLANVGGKGISIPIALGYQTTGIKVAENASSVGLGWNLNANGFAITR